MAAAPAPASVSAPTGSSRAAAGPVARVDTRKLMAEFIGTFALVFAGCGAVLADHVSGGAVTHVGIALTFGLVVCVMIYATGHISGAHFNPAVSIAFAVSGRFPWRQVPAYVVVQCIAAIVAIGVLALTAGGPLGATVPTIPPTSALVMEVVLSFFLMFVISAVATDHRAEGTMAGVAIGGTVTLCALFGGPLTGASMNPARSLGPAILSGHLDVMWLYVAGPLVGAGLGALAYRAIRCDDEPPADATGCC